MKNFSCCNDFIAFLQKESMEQNFKGKRLIKGLLETQNCWIPTSVNIKSSVCVWCILLQLNSG